MSICPNLLQTRGKRGFHIINDRKDDPEKGDLKQLIYRQKNVSDKQAWPNLVIGAQIWSFCHHLAPILRSGLPQVASRRFPRHLFLALQKT